MFLHHAADCATIVKRLLLSRLQSLNLSMYMILDINENNRKPSNDGLRLFHLFRTGSAPGGSFRFPIRWSRSCASSFLVRHFCCANVVACGRMTEREWGNPQRFPLTLPLPCGMWKYGQQNLWAVTEKPP